jgi:hypothetical protein
MKQEVKVKASDFTPPFDTAILDKVKDRRIWVQPLFRGTACIGSRKLYAVEAWKGEDGGLVLTFEPKND